MAKQVINVGTTANDKKGDSLRAAFQKVNANFTELYTELGLVNDVTLSLGAFEFTGSTMTTTDSTTIVIDQATTVTSNLSVGGDLLPSTAHGGDLGSSTLPWRSLYVSNNTIFIGGVPLGIDANGALTVNGSQVTGGGGGSTLVNGANTVSLGSDGALTLPSTAGVVDRLYSDNGGYRTKLEKKIASSPTTGVIAKLELDLDNGNIRLAIGNYTGGNDQWIDTSTWAFRGDTGSLTLPPAGKIINNNNEWTFGTTGNLTLPAGGTLTFSDATVQSTAWTGIANALRSEGNINIEVNLTDSTKYIWQFGEDGALTLPAGGTILNSSGQPYVNGVSSINTSVSTSIFTDASGDYQYGTLSYDYAVNGVSNSFSIEYSRPLVGGNVDINVGNAVVTGDLTLSGDIKSNGNINIDINLSDSTLRRWQFGEDGNLTLPQGGNISEGGGLTGAIRLTPAGGANANQALVIYPTGFAEGDHIHLTAGGGATELYLGDDLHFVKLTNDGAVVIRADDGVNSVVWGFSPDGTTSIPGDIKSDSNINIEINLSDSTKRIWQFGEDGELTVPGPINGLGNSKLDFTTYGANTAYLTTTSDDTTALIMTATTAELYAHTNILIRTNTDGTAKVWTFGDNGSLTFPDATVQTTAWAGIPGPYDNDADAATAGVAVGYPYHKTGTSGQVFVRLS